MRAALFPVNRFLRAKRGAVFPQTRQCSKNPLHSLGHLLFNIEFFLGVLFGLQPIAQSASRIITSGKINFMSTLFHGLDIGFFRKDLLLRL